jgi:hypothetical protein
MMHGLKSMHLLYTYLEKFIIFHKVKGLTNEVQRIQKMV